MKKKYFIYLLIIPFLLLALFFNKNKILSYDEKFGYPLKKLVRSIKGNDIYDYSTDNIKTKFLNIIHQQDQNLVDVNKVKDFTYNPKLKGYAIKQPVFSFNKFPNVDKRLGPEMKSTGESILFIDSLKDDQFYELYSRRKMYLSK